MRPTSLDSFSTSLLTVRLAFNSKFFSNLEFLEPDVFDRKNLEQT